MSEAKKLVLAFLVGIVLTFIVVGYMQQPQKKEAEANAVMLKELKTEIVGLNEEIGGLQTEVSNLSKKKTNLEADVKDMSSKVTKLQEQLESTNGELKKLKKAYKNLGMDF